MGSSNWLNLWYLCNVVAENFPICSNFQHKNLTKISILRKSMTQEGLSLFTGPTLYDEMLSIINLEQCHKEKNRNWLYFWTRQIRLTHNYSMSQSTDKTAYLYLRFAKIQWSHISNICFFLIIGLIYSDFHHYVHLIFLLSYKWTYTVWQGLDCPLSYM